MSYTRDYAVLEPTRAELDAGTGWQLLEFGAPWCGHCMAAQPALEAFGLQHAVLPHLKVEDGKGRALGRSFRIKLWPTVILLCDGQEQARVVRPVEGRDLGALAEVLMHC